MSSSESSVFSSFSLPSFGGTQQAITNVTGGNKTAGLFVTLLLIIAIVIGLYYVIMFFIGAGSKTTYVVSEVDSNQHGKGPIVPGAKMNRDAGSSEYSFGFWLYVRDFNKNFGRPKVLFYRGDGQEYGPFPSMQVVNPLVFLYPTTNTLGIRFSTKKDLAGDQAPFHSDGSLKGGRYFNAVHACDVPDIPLQKWVNIVVSVGSNHADIYVDGKLFRSCSYNSPISNVNGSLDVFPAPSGEKEDNYRIDGSMRSLFFKPKPMNPSEALSMYYRGPGGGTGLFERLFGIQDIKVDFTDVDGSKTSYDLTL